MVLTIKNGKIRVSKNTIEPTKEAIIYLNFEDDIITNRSDVRLYINNEIAQRIKNNTFKINQSILTKKEVQVSITLNNLSGNIKTYKTLLSLEGYFSFGKEGLHKFPQLVIDLNSRIDALEKKIEKINKKNKII